MSLKAMLWAFNQETRLSAEKFVLVALGNFSSETGKAYPSVETVCRLTMLGERTVRRSLSSLEQQGIILNSGKKVGSTQQIKVYQLPPDACEACQDGTLTKTAKRLPKDHPTGTQNGEQGTTKLLKKFCVPTFEEMELHASKIGLPATEINGFFNHHEARGWKFRGGLPMKSWQAAMVTWRENYRRFNTAANKPARVGPTQSEVIALVKEKWGDDQRHPNWAISFFCHWAPRNWKRDGRLIDWPIELSKNVSTWRAQP